MLRLENIHGSNNALCVPAAKVRVCKLKESEPRLKVKCEKKEAEEEEEREREGGEDEDDWAPLWPQLELQSL